MSNLNGAALDPRDINVPSMEPMVASAQQPRAAAELDDTMDDNRREQLEQSAPPLQAYLAEKYQWKRSAGGRWYLSPLQVFLDYVAGVKADPSKGRKATDGAASRAADYGLGIIYPNGEHGKTEESALVEKMVVEARDLLESFRAFGENEAKAFERFLIERVTRNATYAATTQFELENWAARSAARGQDASQHQNFGEKESRMNAFAIAAGVALAVCREVLPQQHISADTFNKAASRVIYENANFEADKLQTPSQQGAQQKAGAEAAKLTARRF